ncbi:hypothetical protein ACF3NS_09670 [Arsenicicoccus cauae]|uniref:hypothetical protein n=1 Tax=Arsenicicoccus cauae TaxID=2663847 RepID=UPI00370D6E27
MSARTDAADALDPTDALTRAVEPDPTTVAVGLDPVAATVTEADHLAEHLGEALAEHGHVTIVSTHLVPGPGGASSHLALSIRWCSPPPGERDLVAVVDRLCERLVPETAAAAAHEIGAATGGSQQLRRGYADLADSAAEVALLARDGTTGRAVVYPGRQRLVGELTVAELVDRCAIDAVEGIAGTVVTHATVVRTRDFVRPVWRDGRLVLLVQPAADDTVVPFENPAPTPCCADHA